MGKIYENNRIYSLLRPYVDLCIRRSYRKVETAGMENLPEGGAVIFSPNHCNTLMDALVILRTDRKDKVFGARADLFNNPFIGKIMTFLRILPMVRQRDGLRNVLKNYETTQLIVEIIDHGVPFCIYPEGTHRTMHSLRPLGKGIFRAALSAVETFKDEKPVYIVPVGIEYGDYFRFRSTSLVTFGKPLDVREIIRDIGPENESRCIERLRGVLKERMSGLITYIKDDDDYQAKWTLVKMLAADTPGPRYGECGSHLYKDMLKNRSIVENIEARLEESPEEMRQILEDVTGFEKRRKKEKISIYSFGRKDLEVTCLKKGIAAILSLPYFLFCSLASLPMWVAAELIRSKIRDKAFRNTVSFGVRLALGTIWYPVAVTLCFCHLPWWIALLTALLMIPAYSFVYDYAEYIRRWFSDLRLLGNRQIQAEYDSIIKKF